MDKSSLLMTPSWKSRDFSQWWLTELPELSVISRPDAKLTDEANRGKH